MVLELMSHKSPCFLQTLDHFLALILGVFYIYIYIKFVTTTCSCFTMYTIYNHGFTEYNLPFLVSFTSLRNCLMVMVSALLLSRRLSKVSNRNCCSFTMSGRYCVARRLGSYITNKCTLTYSVAFTHCDSY